MAPDVALPPQFGDTVKLRVRKQTIKHKYNGFLAVVTDNSLTAALWVQLLEGPEINGIFKIPRAQAEIVRRAPPKDDTPTEIGNGVTAPATPAAPAVVAADATAATEAAAGGGAALATSASGAAQEVMATGAAAVVASASGAPQEAPDAVAPAALNVEAALADFSNYESDNGEGESPLGDLGVFDLLAPAGIPAVAVPGQDTCKGGWWPQEMQTTLPQGTWLPHSLP